MSTMPPAPSVSPSPSTSKTPRVQPVTRKRRMKSEKASESAGDRPAGLKQARIDPGVDVDQADRAAALAGILERVAHCCVPVAT